MISEVQSMGGCFHCFGAEVRQNIMVGVCHREGRLSSWQPKGRERETERETEREREQGPGDKIHPLKAPLQ
jgi:hypothetical protein